MLIGKKTVKVDEKAEDIELILQCLQAFKEGKYDAVDESRFHDKRIGEEYNAMVDAAMDRSNRMVMRLNDAMVRIGNSQPVKEMLEEVDAQTSSITDMREASAELGESIEKIQGAASNIQDDSHDIIRLSSDCTDKMNDSIRLVDVSTQSIAEISKQMESFKEKAKKINEIIDKVSELASESSLLGLNASIEAARAGEAGRGFAIVAEQVNQLSSNTSDCAEDVVKYVGELMEEIDALASSVQGTTADLEKGNQSVHASIDVLKNMNLKLTDINEAIEQINGEIGTQSSLTDYFVNNIQSISAGYDTLAEKCLGIGARFYRISRDIDCARSDMFRYNSRLTKQDMLLIYEMDHLIFSWRVYNHMAGYETLRLEQLNNPKGCKVGKWFTAQTDPMITGDPGFKKAVRAHDELHAHAVNSWTAANAGDREEALREFDKGLYCFDEYCDGLHELSETMKKNGITEATPIWVFQG